MEVSFGVGNVGPRLESARASGRRIAFVPTMGNLHAGHLALVDAASREGDFVVVSIFVNPFQFGEGEDFATYPRTLDEDREKLASAGVDYLFVPAERDIYPHGAERITRIEVPDVGRILCGEFRPGFFRGVATVVGILFNLVGPAVALFGEKDYQQLVVIRRMVRDLRFPVQITAVPTVREDDGLALSSRNGYLSRAERQCAPILYQALESARDRIAQGSRNYVAVEQAGKDRLASAGFRPDYFAVRRAGDLGEPRPSDRELRILCAAWLGSARLIDNISAAPACSSLDP